MSTTGALVIALGLSLVPSTGRSAENLDLKSLIDVAMERSPVVQDRAKALEAANGALLGARIVLPSNPQLVYSGVTDRFNANQGEGSQSIELEQQFGPWGQRGKRIAEARAAFEAAERDLDAARLDVTLGATRGYLRILILTDKLRLIADMRTLSNQVQQAAEAKRAGGLISDVAYQITLFDSLGLDNEYRTARTAFDAELAELRRLVGLPDVEVDPTGGLPDFVPIDVDESALLQQALNRPDLSARRKTIESRQAGIAVLKRGRLPELRLRLGYSRESSVFVADDFQYFSGFSPSIERLKDTDGLVVFGAAISLPLFRRNQGELITATSEADRLTIQLRTAESQIGTDVRRLLDRIRGRGTILARMQPVLPGLAAALQDVTRAYTLGEYSVDRYLVEKDRLVRARLSYDDALLDYLEAIVDLEQTTGRTLYEPKIVRAGATP